MLACATVARPGSHATVVRSLRGVSSTSTRPRAGPSHFEYPCASAYNNILLRRRYTTPAPTPSSSSSSATSASSSTDAPPPLPQAEGSNAVQKKPKLDLRPKPKPPSTNVADPLKATAPPVRKSSSNMKQLKAKSPYYAMQSSQAKPVEAPAKPAATPLSSLGAAKKEVQEVVHDAEAHGILTPPPADANWFRRTMHQGIQLAKFYFRGVKLVWSRRKAIVEINKRIKAGGAPLARSEFRLIETQKDDIKKIIPFLIIALILEEVIPLIAIYIPGMLPSTCILPSQRDKIEAKRAEKAMLFRRQHQAVFGALKQAAEVKKTDEQEYFIVGMDKLSQVNDAPMAICGLLGLSTLGPDFLRIRRINKRLSFLTQDDGLLLSEGTQAETLRARELVEALQERGIPNPTTQSSPAELQSLLNRWLGHVRGIPEDDAFSRRLALVLTYA